MGTGLYSEGRSRTIPARTTRKTQSMDFYASLTINRCHFDCLCEIWAHETGDLRFPFRAGILSPLVARNGILERLRHRRAECKVMFDSGGFHVQQGRLQVHRIGMRLRRLYEENSWAERFALPDVPITSMDSPGIVKRKLTSTLQQYRSFPKHFADSMKQRLLPVVHGTTAAELYRSLRAARAVGSTSIGFGAFSTSGPNAGVNSLTAYGLRLLIQFASLCAKWHRKTHVFGIGGPTAVALLRHLAIDSFDSAGWIRTAAYGNVYLPYVGAVNITGVAESRRSLTMLEFTRLKRATGHRCPFCEDRKQLVRSWRHRALHNYCTVLQLANDTSETAQSTLERLLEFNPRFASYLQLILHDRSTLTCSC